MAGNAFDAFDAPSANAFDEFDEPAQADDRGMMRRVGDWFAGNQKDPNMSLAQDAGLQLPPAKAAKLMALIGTTLKDDRLQSGMLEIIPSATFSRDEFDNLVVTAPVGGVATPEAQYTQFYLNPKGLDRNNVMQAGGAIALGQGLAAAMPAVTAGTGLLAMGGLGATEATIAEFASSSLSNDQFDWSLPLFGFMGGVTGKKLADAAPRVFNMFKSNPIRAFDDEGKMLPDVAAELRRAGLNPDDISQQAATTFRRLTETGIDPAQAARTAQAADLPVAIPLTRGEMTGEAGQMLMEDAIRKGAFGEQNAGRMAAMRAAQLSRIQENIPAIQSQIADGSDIISRGQGGATAQATLSAQREAARTSVNQSYAAARNAAPAFVPLERAAEVSTRLRAAISSFNPQTRGATDEIVSGINDVLETGGDIQQLFRLREQLVNAGDAGSTAQAAATSVKRALDDELIRLADDALLEGDGAAVGLWTGAIREYADFATTWKDSGILKELTEAASRDGDRLALKVDPANAANYILGASDNNIKKTGNIVRDLDVLQKRLPLEQWNQIRQEAFLRIINPLQAVEAGAPAPRAQTFSSIWNAFKRNNPGVARQLFTPDEQSLISQLAAVSSQVTNSTQNRSNSANSMMNMTSRLAQAFGGSKAVQTALMAPILNIFKTTYGGAVATGALNAAPVAATTLGQRTAAAVGGSASSSEAGSNLIDQKINQLTGFGFRR